MVTKVKKIWLKKFLISSAGKGRAKEFEKASRNVEKAQNDVLQRIVQSCTNTAFGKDHNFAGIRTAEDYRKAVPLRDFEGHRSYIDRMEKGESDILFPGKPLFYNTTSGTSTKPKLIPVSQMYFEKGYRDISRFWLYGVLRDNPRLFNGKNLSSVGMAEEGRTSDGTPYGAISGAVVRNLPGFLKDVYSSPYPVFCMHDYAKKYYALMRGGLGCDVAYIVCANPSSLIRFHQAAVDDWESIVRDIHDGGLREDVAAEVPADGREEVLKAYPADPGRAKELEQMMNEHGENLRPKHYWPNLVCINTWKQGNCAQVIPKLQDFYPETTAIREFGYQASEGRMGLALSNEMEASALMVHVYHFEFIHDSQRDSENPEMLLAHQLEAGQQYYITLSNASGLYRYDINDLMEVTGHYNQVPLFRFIRKGDGFTSLTGEKLTETQVLEAMDRTRQSEGLDVPYFTLCCDEKELCYKLFLEFPPDSAAERKEAFVQALDGCLKTINPEYDTKRDSGRLAAPVVHELPGDALERVKATMVARGMAREGQYKMVYLQRKPEVIKLLEELAL